MAPKKTICYILILFAGSLNYLTAQEKTYELESFNEVIVNPHIETIFEKSDREAVVVENIDVPIEKLTVEVKGKSLQIYLEGAKIYTKSEKDHEKKQRQDLYSGTVVTVKIYYREFDELSLRGEETHRFKSEIKGDELDLKIYGESRVLFNHLHLDSFDTTIYGEAYLEVKTGEVDRQKVISYGESEVNTLGLVSDKAKVTAYGEGDIKLNVKTELKITAYGEAAISYKGSPMVNRGLVIGEAEIRQLD